MKQYLALMQRVIEEGAQQADRTGVGTLAIFGHQLRFHLSLGLPVVTTKKLHLRSVIHELLWMLRGDTNVQYLKDNGVHIWDEWADMYGDLGPIYGHQWRRWPRRGGGHIDQVTELINEIRRNPASRRQIVTAWNPADLPLMALSPCHCFFQTTVMNGKLSLQVYQRSCDVFLGLPFNIASYALLAHMLAQQCDLAVEDLIWTGGDVHLYLNHLEQAAEQIGREPYPLPRLELKRRPPTLFDYAYEDFEIVGYQSHPAIKAEVAV